MRLKDIKEPTDEQLEEGGDIQCGWSGLIDKCNAVISEADLTTDQLIEVAKLAALCAIVRSLSDDYTGNVTDALWDISERFKGLV